MARLVKWLNETAMPARVVEGFKNFLQVHPFAEGNGRAGRALLALMLREAGLLRDPAAVEHFLYDYFEVGGFKQRFGALIEEIVVQKSNASWNEYFKELFQELRENHGHMPPIPGR
jgi:fido (protein-threonine AMPylation protein)